MGRMPGDPIMRFEGTPHSSDNFFERLYQNAPAYNRNSIDNFEMPIVDSLPEDPEEGTICVHRVNTDEGSLTMSVFNQGRWVTVDARE